MKKKIFRDLLLSLVVATICPIMLSAQSATINKYLQWVADGRMNDVKKKMPELTAEFSGEPGVILLQGIVLDNAQDAIPYYKKVLDNFPNTEWAQHALWRMIQYYSIVSDTASANKLLARFRIKYPTSPFLAAATEAVRFSVSDAKFNNREKYHNPDSKVQEKAQEVVNEMAQNDNAKQKYGLQVGIYSNKAAADSEKARFIKTARMRTEVVEKLLNGEKKYAVVIGNYDSEEQATKAKTLVDKQCGCESLVYKK